MKIHLPHISLLSLVFSLLILLSVSVYPAMAAEAVNEKFGICPTCGEGSGELSSLPGFENRTLPTVNIREISPDTNPATAMTDGAGSIPSVRGVRTMHTRFGTIDIQDPRIMTGDKRGLASTADAAPDPGLGSIIANLSRDGYDLAGSGMHRYETTLKSDDFLSLNNSQKTVLAGGGFALISEDTVLSFRDVSTYAFTNRTTGSRVYLMEVQRLDRNGDPIGDPDRALSPDFTSGGARFPENAGTASSETGGTCFWEWALVVLFAIGLIISILALISGSVGAYGGVLFTPIVAVATMLLFKGGGYHVWKLAETVEKDLIVIGIVTGLVMLIFLAYAIYDLGVCMGWWDPGFAEEYIWSYQHRFSEAENGLRVPVALHDRFALALVADTRTDPDAAWEIRTYSGGLIQKSTMTVSNENGTIQSWLFEATQPGIQDLTLHYSTNKPLPPAIPGTDYRISLEVAAGGWKITTVDATLGEESTPSPSLAVNKNGIPSISYHDGKTGQIRYAVQKNAEWTFETAATTAGTGSTSLAFDAAGNPAIVFGDGLHFGNLMYGFRNSSGWHTETIQASPVENAGHYASLVFDAAGSPRIAYSNGNHFASLQYVTRNGTSWDLTVVDHGSNILGDTGYDPSLVLDSLGRPLIAYRDGKHYSTLMVARQNAAGGWDLTKVDNGGSMTADTGYQPSAALDSSGRPHISYYDRDNGDLRYASWNGTGWILETLDAAGDVGAYSSLAIDSRNQPHLSYYDATNHELRYTTKNPVTRRWVTRTIDNDGDVGTWTSLALDPTGRPSIVYYDATNHALKFAGWTG